MGNVLGNWVRRGSKQEANSTAPVSWTQHMGAPGQGRQRWGDLDGCSDRFRDREPVVYPRVPPTLSSCWQNPGGLPGLMQALGTLEAGAGLAPPAPRALQQEAANPRSPGQGKVPLWDGACTAAPQDPRCVLTAVPVGGVRAQADIAGNEQLWEGGADLLDGLDGRCVLCIRGRAPLVL